MTRKNNAAIVTADKVRISISNNRGTMNYYNSRKKKEVKEDPEQLGHEEARILSQSDMSSSNGVEIDENKIYFYCQVGEKEVLDLNRTIKRLDQEMQFFGIKLNISPPPIELHIHSEGGSAFAGIAAYDCIRSCKAPVHTYIDGCAASAATLLFLAGTKRILNKNSFMLIHQVSSAVHGKFEELKDELKNQEKIMDTVKKIYMETSLLDEETIVELMKRDLWLDSKTVVEYGFANNIL